MGVRQLRIYPPALCSPLCAISDLFVAFGHKRYQRQKFHEPRGNLDVAIASHRSRFTRAVQRIFPMLERDISETSLRLEKSPHVLSDLYCIVLQGSVIHDIFKDGRCDHLYAW